MRMMIRIFLVFFLLSNFSSSLIAQTEQTEIPFIGAEIFIEPGQTQEEIETWFKRLQENGMTITRIRMFETYMHNADGTWDFTLFDYAFQAGEKYNIKIYANLFPATGFSDVGGFKFPRDEAHLRSIASYIAHLVSHFNQFNSLYGWVPINEPGAGYVYDEPFTQHKFKEWKQSHHETNYDSQGYAYLGFEEEQFLLDYNVWFLRWLTTEIRKYDSQRPIHVNNHGIFQNVSEYDFQRWREFLTSLGGSAHASWHFGYFKRDQFAVAMSANSEILRSGAGDIPWMMTELQGGNNTYSGYDAMCPTPEEITQWLWTTLATGSKGSIFWCLNPRRSGYEAGEWALLDYQNNPTDRMKAARAVANVIQANASLLANAKVVESGINILYTRESLWIERKLQTGGPPAYEGRAVGGVMKSALSYFEALGEMGIQSNFKEISEFDFLKGDYTGSVIILAHQLSIPSIYRKKLEDFVRQGGKLIIDGLTGYYDERAVCMLTEFPFEQLFGGNIKEFKFIDTLFDLTLTDPKLTLKTHLWRGVITPTTAKPLGLIGNEVIASKNVFGKGEVVWVPTLMGLAQRITGDYKPLITFLQSELSDRAIKTPFKFKDPASKLMMKTLQSGSSYISVIINKSSELQKIKMVTPTGVAGGLVLSSPTPRYFSGNKISLKAEDTVVMLWK